MFLYVITWASQGISSAFSLTFLLLCQTGRIKSGFKIITKQCGDFVTMYIYLHLELFFLVLSAKKMSIYFLLLCTCTRSDSVFGCADSAEDIEPSVGWSGEDFCSEGGLPFP
jgi:hypothetical protein